MHRLAEVSFNSDQAFGTLATRLIRAGLIARDAGPGRVLTHRLTPPADPGGRGGVAGRGPANRVVEASLSVLSVEEKDQLARLLAKALGGTGAASPSAPPSGPSSP